MHLKTYKTQARRCLKNRKLRTFRITLRMGALAVLCGVAAYVLPLAVSFGAAERYWILALESVLLLVYVTLSGSLRQGRAAWLYCGACGKEPSRVQFMYWLRAGRAFRATLLYLDLRIRKTTWTLLLSIPGAVVLTAGVMQADRINTPIRMFVWIGGTVALVIGLFVSAVINQKYALSPILFACSPQKGVRSAVRGSCFLMEDDCLRLLLVKLSFIPWALTCAALFPAIYVIPYYQQTTACMLRGILRDHTI